MDISEKAGWLGWGKAENFPKLRYTILDRVLLRAHRQDQKRSGKIRAGSTPRPPTSSPVGSRSHHRKMPANRPRLPLPPGCAQCWWIFYDNKSTDNPFGPRSSRWHRDFDCPPPKPRISPFPLVAAPLIPSIPEEWMPDSLWL